jgi:hypothetical protein
MFTFVLFFPERFPAFRVMYSAGQIACGENAMAHRNALNLDAAHNSAIREEIGERLRVLLSKEQPKTPPRVQHLLDRLNGLEAPRGPVPQPPPPRLMATESSRMEELDRRKEEALVAVALCTGTLIACFGITLALL